MAVRDIIYLILLIVLILLSACFSGMDMAYSKVKIPKLEKSSQEGNKRSKRVLSYAKDYDSTIATILFGNDFVNILASSITALFAQDVLEPIMPGLGSTVSSLVLLFVLLVFGEITPKAVSKDHSFAITRVSVGFLTICHYLFLPFVHPLNLGLSKLAKAIVGTHKEPDVASDEELENMVDEIQKEGIIDSDQSELLHKSIDFKETNCYEIMTPRVKLFGIDIEEGLDEFLKKPDCFHHSRIIVYKKDMDHILGYIQVKTLLRSLVKGEKINLKSMTMPIVAVPRTMMISQAMVLMKENHHHIVLVKDEYGGTEGIITMEDILEELVGELWDEDEKPETYIRPLKVENTYLVNGNTNIDDFLNTFHLDPDKLDDEFTTVSGFITHQEERFPKVGDVITYENLQIQVVKMENEIVDLAIVHCEPEENEDDEA